jgi:O-antigen ligase
MMRSLFFAMVLMTLVISLVILKEFRTTWHYNEDNRVQMLGMNPNLLGGFFMQLIPVLMSFAISLKKFKSRIFYFSAFFFSSLAVMFTYSRGAYLSAMASLLVITLFAGKKSFIKIGMGALVALFFISVFFGYGHIIPVSVKERFEMVKDKDKREADESVRSREYVWSIAKGYISQSPIYGYGYEASAYLLPLDTHNMYLDLLLEGGVIALIFFIFIFLIGFKVAYSVFKNSSDEFEKALSLGFIGTLVALFMGNFFGTRMNHFASNGYFAILMGMVARLYAEKRKQGIIKG